MYSFLRLSPGLLVLRFIARSLRRCWAFWRHLRDLRAVRRTKPRTPRQRDSHTWYSNLYICGMLVLLPELGYRTAANQEQGELNNGPGLATCKPLAKKHKCLFFFSMELWGFPPTNAYRDCH